MQVHQIYTHNELRNFTYLIALDDGSALVLDPWDAAQINPVLSAHKLKLRAVINTHEHWDHTKDNKALVSEHGCEVWAHKNGEGKIPELTRTLSAHEVIDLGGGAELEVLDTPGHTFAHLCFILRHDNSAWVFTGDTLFNAGVGNCHNGGDPAALYTTIAEQFHTLDDSVAVYPGHDYLENNLEFTLNLEPSNQQATAWLEKVRQVDPGVNPLVTTIGDERQFNTFFRLDSAEIRQSLALDQASEKDVFLALRKKRNSW